MLSRQLPLIGSVLISLVSSGCLPRGDTYFRVSGTLSEELEQRGEPCVLGIHAVSSDRLIDYRSVGRTFQESFVLPAKAIEYYFEAKCGEGRLYRSKSYKFGEKDTFNKTIDLGLLHVASK
jgi:hypothetical protein